MAKRYLYFDSETCNGGSEYGMAPHEFVRLFQYAWDDGPVVLKEVHTEEDLEFVRDLLRAADYVVGHNVISSDLGWIFGADSLEPLQMALDKKVIDTFYLANLVTPFPITFVKRSGQRVTLTTQSPVGHSSSWLALDNLCYQFGIDGKLGDLKDLAKTHNPPKTKIADLDFSLIPLDDPEFLAYAEQDVIAVRELWKYLLQKMKSEGFSGVYVWREMALMAATVGQMQRNGILVNQDFALSELEKQEEKKASALQWLVDKYDFPTTGKAPWSTAKGKDAVLRVLADYGIAEETRPDWPRTPTGALKQGGEDLMMLAEGTDAEEFVYTLAQLKGVRSTHQQVMDNIKEDGRVHPDVTSLQRSGRWSFTKPGVTIFGERTEKLKAEKEVFTAGPGKVLAGFDYSNADSRAMGALSGDPEFNKRFEVDENGEDLYDGHNLTGEKFFGVEVYYAGGRTDKKARPLLRNASKPGGHGQNYNLGPFKMAHMLNDVCRKLKLDLHFWAPKHKKSKSKLPPIERRENSIDTREMIQSFNAGYPWLKAFKDASVAEAEEFGYVTNSWGRRMAVDKGREWTQAPALYGQSTTREVMGDAVLRLCAKGEYYIRALRAIIHDELLMEFDEATIERDIQVVKECMETVFDPKTLVGTPIPFPVGYGYGKTWKDAGH